MYVYTLCMIMNFVIYIYVYITFNYIHISKQKHAGTIGFQAGHWAALHEKNVLSQ